ncbi:restriction endonuclease subunit S [Arthrobacter psychrolactophilus]
MNRQSGWEGFRLGDIADISWGDTSTTKASYIKSGYTAYSAAGPDGYLPTADYKSSGIVISAIGAQAGKTWLATGEWSCIKNTLRILPASDQISIEFLYWATRRENFWPIRGSAQPFISQGDCRDLTIYAPSIQVQKAIADVLGALDDKIAANTKLAATAAQLTQSLFSRAVKESSDEYVLSEITELLSRGVTPKYSEDTDTMMILNQKCVRGQRVELEPARRHLVVESARG